MGINETPQVMSACKSQVLAPPERTPRLFPRQPNVTDAVVFYAVLNPINGQ